jgi:protein-S-isoprenylcysteine O-methyltransferase Ste14
VAAKVAFYGVIVCWWLFCLTFWLRKRPPRTREAQRDRSSYLGLLLQSVGYFIVWYFPLRHRGIIADRASSYPAWLEWALALLALAIAIVSVALVNWAARCLGKQWSLGARLVENHMLIEDGPYRLVRNPIYTGMLGMLIATDLAVTQWTATALIILLAAIAVFVVGTYIRIRIEERLLRGAFGTQFDEYAHRVPALIPGIY